MFAVRLVLIALACGLAAGTSEPQRPFYNNILNLIKDQGKLTTGKNFPPDSPIKKITKLMGARMDLFDLMTAPTVNHDPDFIKSLPENFDAREKWPECPSINQIRDQGECGACWAVSAVTAMTDRVCIYSNGTKNFNLSIEDALTCSKDGDGCYGGALITAWQDWVSDGFVSGGNYNSHEGCKPYTIPTCEHHLKNCTEYKSTPVCVHTCEDGYNVPYYKDKKRGKTYYTLYGEDNIRAELYKNGPTMGSFVVSIDMLDFNGGIYRQRNFTEDTVLGLHAVRAVGWGVENNTKYWLIANSWGPGFGDKGFFKLERGAESTYDKVAVGGEPLLGDY